MASAMRTQIAFDGVLRRCPGRGATVRPGNIPKGRLPLSRAGGSLLPGDGTAVLSRLWGVATSQTPVVTSGRGGCAGVATGTITPSPLRRSNGRRQPMQIPEGRLRERAGHTPWVGSFLSPRPSVCGSGVTTGMQPACFPGTHSGTQWHRCLPSIWDANLELFWPLRRAQDASKTHPKRLPRRSAGHFARQ